MGFGYGGGAGCGGGGYNPSFIIFLILILLFFSGSGYGGCNVQEQLNNNQERLGDCTSSLYGCQEGFSK